METVLAWHFVGDTLRDLTPIPPDGEWLVHDGQVALCHSGLHASTHVLDAMLYAPGVTACRVECGEIEESDQDKFVCRRRRILWRVNVWPMVAEWARDIAAGVARESGLPSDFIDHIMTWNGELDEKARKAEDKVCEFLFEKSIEQSALFTITLYLRIMFGGSRYKKILMLNQIHNIVLSASEYRDKISFLTPRMGRGASMTAFEEDLVGRIEKLAADQKGA